MKTAIFLSLVVICVIVSLFNAYAKAGKHFSFEFRHHGNTSDAVVK